MRVRRTLGALRLADLRDLDTNRWVFRVMHPKGEGEPWAKIGAEVDIEDEATRILVLDYLVAREKHLRDLGFDPKGVRPLVPNENGEHYSEGGWRSSRLKVFRRFGIEADFRILRRTHGQRLIDGLQAMGYEGAAYEVAAKRLRNTPETVRRNYANRREEPDRRLIRRSCRGSRGRAIPSWPCSGWTRGSWASSWGLWRRWSRC